MALMTEDYEDYLSKEKKKVDLIYFLFLMCPPTGIGSLAG